MRLGAADWSIRAHARAAWRKDPDGSAELFAPVSDLKTLIEWMRDPAQPALLGMDVGLGVPRGFGDGFRAWLAASDAPMSERCAASAQAWSEARPFFRVPPGQGELQAFRARGRLTRALDDRLGAKSPFILSGIPGCVGSSCAQLWEALRTGLDVRVWPFDGPLRQLLRPGAVVIGEIYPSAYLRRAVPERRLRKSRPADRAAALERLGSPSGPGAEQAIESEDVFDAWVGLVHLQQAWTDGRLEDGTIDPVFEGGLLGGDA